MKLFAFILLVSVALADVPAAPQSFSIRVGTGRAIGSGATFNDTTSFNYNNTNQMTFN